MAFVHRQERKLGPHNLQTGKYVGPGSYNNPHEMSAGKKQSK